MLENEIISYTEMCQREGVNLQKGMNFRLNGKHSVILMSVRPNAPYEDCFEEDNTMIIYEGHDAHRSHETPNPKIVDQPQFSPRGSLTENGKFYRAVNEYKNRHKKPEIVYVYEKLKPGIWSYNGIFNLIDAWIEDTERRKVFKFKLQAIGYGDIEMEMSSHILNRRLIPTKVKIEVWKRDKGKCVMCGATTDLHFDHIIPWSKGGSSNTPENIQLLCGKHNLEKHDKII